jgi:hypothetical protein
MNKQLDVSIDPNSDPKGERVQLSLENQKLGLSSFWIHKDDFYRCCKDLNIANDYGALDRMQEIISWLSKQQGIRFEEIE